MAKKLTEVKTDVRVGVEDGLGVGGKMRIKNRSFQNAALGLDGESAALLGKAVSQWTEDTVAEVKVVREFLVEEV